MVSEKKTSLVSTIKKILDDNKATNIVTIDLKDKSFSVALVHPGWVRTDMGGPNGLIDTKTSVTGLMGVIEALDLQSSGSFFSYDGSLIPW